ncbi:MAG: FAD-dependent oxidoreductase [Cyanobacteria bacterium P01_H01_bin.15]
MTKPIADWLVIGGGITGAAVAYELQQTGYSVILLEKSPRPENATSLGYGGLGFWSGRTSWWRTLAKESRDLHQSFAERWDTELRELPLLLTVDHEEDPTAITNQFSDCEIPPQWLSPKEAKSLEPELNISEIQGAFQAFHGQVNGFKLQQAYLREFQVAGGRVYTGAVIHLTPQNLSQQSSCPKWLITTHHTNYLTSNVLIAAGSGSRKLLDGLSLHLPLYFTEEQVLISQPQPLQLRTMVMSATLQRLPLETAIAKHWNTPAPDSLPAIIDTGAIQMPDGRLFIGQRTSAPKNDPSSPASAEQALRSQLRKILPRIADLPATLRTCQVTFSPREQPLVGPIHGHPGLYLFNGFTSPLLLVPPLARHFAQQLRGQSSHSLIQSLDTVDCS